MLDVWHMSGTLTAVTSTLRELFLRAAPWDSAGGAP